MAEIHAAELAVFKQGRRRLMQTSAAGSFEVQGKDGLRTVAFGPGELVLVDEFDTVVSGPISPDGARQLAHQMLDGDSRVLTDPRALLVLATAVAGWV